MFNYFKPKVDEKTKKMANIAAKALCFPGFEQIIINTAQKYPNHLLVDGARNISNSANEMFPVIGSAESVFNLFENFIAHPVRIFLLEAFKQDPSGATFHTISSHIYMFINLLADEAKTKPNPRAWFEGFFTLNSSIINPFIFSIIPQQWIVRSISKIEHLNDYLLNKNVNLATYTLIYSQFYAYKLLDVVTDLYNPTSPDSSFDSGLDILRTNPLPKTSVYSGAIFAFIGSKINSLINSGNENNALLLANIFEDQFENALIIYDYRYKECSEKYQNSSMSSTFVNDLFLYETKDSPAIQWLLSPESGILRRLKLTGHLVADIVSLGTIDP